MKKLFSTVAISLVVASFLGTMVGLLCKVGQLPTNGRWVDWLDWIASIELDKASFFFLAGGALYVMGWATLGKLPKVYTFAKWALVKCFIGVAVVPVFAFVAGYFIPELAVMRALAFTIAAESYVLAAASYFIFTYENA